MYSGWIDGQTDRHERQTDGKIPGPTLHEAEVFQGFEAIVCEHERQGPALPFAAGNLSREGRPLGLGGAPRCSPAAATSCNVSSHSDGRVPSLGHRSNDFLCSRPEKISAAKPPNQLEHGPLVILPAGRAAKPL